MCVEGKNKCVNGTCINVDITEDDRGYKCACDQGYIGENCENGNEYYAYQNVNYYIIHTRLKLKNTSFINNYV